MKFLSLFIAIGVTLATIYTGYLNINAIATIMCPIQHVNFDISIAHLIAIMFMLGIISGFTFCAFSYAGKIDLIQAYKKKYEKMSVQSDSDDSRIKVLEEKIKTLEIALDNALRNEQ